MQRVQESFGPDLPRGVVTLLFSDIEGSTRLLQRLGDQYGEALMTHRRLLRGAFEERGGREVNTEGDGIFFAFLGARNAVEAAIEGQQRLARACMAGRGPPACQNRPPHGRARVGCR